MVELVLGIVGMAIAILQTGYQAAASEWGAFIDADAMKISRELASRMSKNNALKEKLTNAYNEQNTEIINSTFRGMGFGPRAQKLAEMKAKGTKEYQDKINKINAENVRLEQNQQEANNIALLAGSSISGNVQAQQAIDQLNQNINGGTK